MKNLSNVLNVVVEKKPFVTDPNIFETGEQARRALHNNNDNECCFHICSEEQPGSGICTNCTDDEPHRKGRNPDPPTAPQCDILPVQSGSTGELKIMAKLYLDYELGISHFQNSITNLNYTWSCVFVDLPRP